MVAATPTRLGRYQILDEIGKGAMGVVYLAKDPVIGRLVALKTFRMGGDLDDEELRQSRERFMREAQSAGILSHPNIVTVHDVVEETAEGVTFITMEFVRGTDLKEQLRRGDAFDLRAVSEIIWQVAEALEYAHSKGVVHRDIKPGNILITGEGRVKITDFGIARLNTSNLTHDGQLLGTPNYMAPEQIQGREVDHRADVFSLGVVLYEMVTRRKPFQGDNLTVVTHRIVHEPFTPPEEYAGPLPAKLLAILDRALTKDPAQRYQHVGELARDLKLVADEAEAAAVASETREIAPPRPAREGWGAGLGRRLRAASGAVVAAVRKLGVRWSAPAASAGRRRIEPRRLALVAAIAASTALAAGGLALALVAPRGDPATEAARDAELRRLYAYLPWLFEGRRLLAEGDPAGAVQAYAAAERLASGEPRIRERRLEAERRAAEAAALALKEEAVRAALEEGEAAFARRRYTEALEEAEQALTLLPENEEALDLLERSEVALSRRGSRPPRSRPEVPAAGADLPRAASPSPAAAPAVEAVEESTPPAAAAATLHVRFHTEVSQGVLTLYADQQQLLREQFKFAEKVGFFRSRPVPGELERSVSLPPGRTRLRVYVSLDKTRTETVDGNFPAGSVRTLEVRVSERGDLTVSLR